MSLRIGGMGWVTPLGSGVSAVWERLMTGDVAASDAISSPLNPQSYPAFRVPPEATAKAPAHPRLRRSSAISRFAVVAGLAALEDAQLQLDAVSAERTAVIFAISNGGVIYTKRFYHDVVESGAQAASPLLFPETVFNAPASHLAALLGIDGASYTLVGDSSVGLAAVKFAEQLLAGDEVDRCVVGGAEELDWVLCEAYRTWRIAARKMPEAGRPARGAILAEGGAALVLAREGRVPIRAVHEGVPFFRRREAGAALERVFASLVEGEIDLVVGCANGSFVDALEAQAIARHCPRAVILQPKRCLGEALGASALFQVIAGALAVQGRQLPSDPAPPIRTALVSVLGFNQQASGLVLG